MCWHSIQTIEEECMATTAVNTAITKFDDISDFLGEPDTRYLSSGFKRVSRNITEISFRNEQNSMEATANLQYRKDWSIKTDQKKCIPHLSSPDIVILSIQVAELLLTNIVGLTAEHISRSWVRQINIKFGRNPCTDLQHIPISATKENTNEEQDSLNGLVSSFTLSIGSTNVFIEIDHPFSQNDTKERVNFPLLDSESYYFGGNYGEKDLSILNLLHNSDEKSIDAEVELKFSPNYSCSRGIGGDHTTAFNALDSIMLTGQLAQVLIFSTDQTNRESANNLWVRDVEVKIPLPFDPTTNKYVSINALKSKHINKEEKVWSITDSLCQFDNNRGYVKANFVHLLP
jgi:hypothetical protein